VERVRVCQDKRNSTLKSMNIQHFKFPFYHTIISDFFEEDEIEKIILEISSIEPLPDHDIHHEYLNSVCNSKAFNLDKIFNDFGQKSLTLEILNKVESLKLYEYKRENPFLGYLQDVSYSSTYLTQYKNNSYYPPHTDQAIITCLVPIHIKNFKGGRLFFPHYQYYPNIHHNSLLIFPSYETHQLKQIKSEYEEYVRYSINRRYYIK